MCGIAGILNFNNKNAEQQVLEKMGRCMAHRGPDASGLFTENEVGLVHRRLSILDLSSSANQPFTDQSGRFIMVYNGEMYNFLEVKSILKEYHFKTNGDTEVLIAAFAKWGPECIQYFKGMFAFAVWDKEEKELTVVRDRLGVKPLYYYKDDTQFIFASEVRTILATGTVKHKINKAAIREFLSYQSIGYPLTIIDGIQQLEAGSCIRVKSGKFEKKIYWRVGSSQVDFDFENIFGVKAHIRELLRNSVESRLVSDVPVGAFLSGGIDSSVIVGLMAEVSVAQPNTFTVAFTEKEYDESSYADIIAKKFNTNHVNILLKPASFLEELENALNAMDTPSGDGVNSFVVSKVIHQSGITVALSGIGGDELFAGYPVFNQFLQFQKNWPLWKSTGFLRKLISGFLEKSTSNKNLRIGQILMLNSLSIENIYPFLRQIQAPPLIRQLTTLADHSFSTSLADNLKIHKSDLHKLPQLSQVSAAEYIGYTQQTLLKDMDQMSMAVSLEVREPFFDHSLIEFVLSVPDIIKKPTYPKSLLVESVKPLLPDEIVHRKKQGFLFPWSVWMKNELKTFCETRINNLSRRSFINASELIKYWKRFLSNDPSIRWAELWLFIVLEYWLEKNNVHD